MRKEFVEGGTREDAEQACPWAAVVVEVEGGWKCFESVDEYETWANQK